MPALRLGRPELPPVLLLALLGVGCGLVDGDIESRSAASWCEEEGVGPIAEVEQMHLVTSEGLRNVRVVLRDAEDRTLVLVYLPSESNSPGQRTEYTLDARGNVIGTTTDDDIDGTLDRVSTSSYDEEGRIVVTSIDDDADGVADTIETWDYSAPGQTKHFEDRNADGAPDGIGTTTYSDTGELLLEEEDRDADGIPDWTKTYSWSDGGLLLETASVDHAAGWSYIVTSEYDDQGRLVRTVEVSDDREFGFVVETTLEYDEANRLARSDRVTTGPGDSAGRVDERYEYDGAGRLTAVTINRGADPDPEQLRSLTRDGEGRLVRDETRETTGELSSAKEFEYGDGENPIRRSEDFDGDGAWDVVTTWTACQ